ncbi:MAG TPA: hypothetical protein VE978_26195 [Chitinophagales bacterium]|nr:hypothetical protein [Chitinophagales bacterium]
MIVKVDLRAVSTEQLKKARQIMSDIIKQYPHIAATIDFGEDGYPPISYTLPYSSDEYSGPN